MKNIISFDLVKNLIKNNIPEEIHHIKELIIDLQDEYINHLARVDISFVYNYARSGPIYIPLDKDLNPTISLFMFSRDTPSNWETIYQKLNVYIDSVYQIAFCIDFVSIAGSNKVSRIRDIKERLIDQIRDYGKLQGTIRVNAQHHQEVDYFTVLVDKR